MMLCIVGSPLYQWDLNRQLEIDSDTLGNKFEVHCCMNGDTSSLVVEPIIDGDSVLVNIPNILLQRNGTLRVYVVTEGDTVYDQSFYVLARPKPDTYVYTETEVLSYRALEERVSKIENGGEGLTIDRANNTFSNALKGNKSGATLSIDEVSPLEHTLTVNVRGKNLFNKESWVSAIGEVEVNGISCLNVIEVPNSYYEVSGDGSAAYMLTVRMYRNSDFDKASNLKATDKNGTTRTLRGNFAPGDKWSVIVYGGERVFFEGWGKRDICVDLSITQLELGTTATEYAPPVPDISAVKVFVNGNEYSVNADGTVNGIVKSVYPITTITTDTEGAIVECEYNRDINKAFAEIYSAFVAMGGNV